MATLWSIFESAMRSVLGSSMPGHLKSILLLNTVGWKRKSPQATKSKKEDMMISFIGEPS